MMDEEKNPKKTLKVRANQGHSLGGLEDSALLEPADPSTLPKTLFHGTSLSSWDQIQASGGLRAMNRSHIHLAAPGAGGLGGLLRKSVEVKLFVDTKRALDRGILFYQSENGVLLSRGLPETDQDAGLLPLDCCSKVVRVGEKISGEERLLWTPPSHGLQGLREVCDSDKAHPATRPRKGRGSRQQPGPGEDDAARSRRSGEEHSAKVWERIRMRQGAGAGAPEGMWR